MHNYDGSIIRGIPGVLHTPISLQNHTSYTKLVVVPDNLRAVVNHGIIQALGLVFDGATLQVYSIMQSPTTAAAHPSLHKYPSLLNQCLGTYPDHEHVITVTEHFQPHTTKVRPVPLAKRDAVTAEVQSMIGNGIWSPIDKSDCAHGMVVVSKKDGGVRVTSDLSPLNKFVIPERHPFPHIEDLLLELRGMGYFSKIDLRKGYFHIPLQAHNRHYTATMTPLGLMAYNRLPMRLNDAAAVFQKCVSKTLRNCKNTISFVDDILVYGRTRKEHDDALEEVFSALDSKEFRLNIEKCQFGRNKITFLGFCIDASGIRPNPDKIEPIKMRLHQRH